MGKPKSIQTAEELADHYYKGYKPWVKENPVLREDYVGKDADKVNRKLERPLTWVGFECWLYDAGIISDLNDYEQNTNRSYDDYQPIIRAIKKDIENDQFTGATVGIYNQNIIARKLGLIDKHEVDKKVIRVTKPK